MRRIGWAVTFTKSSVLAVIKDVLQKLSVPVEVTEVARHGSRLEAGERREFAIGLTTDDDGVTQVEWTRTGGSVIELKKLYTAVQEALDMHYEEGQCVHRYGSEVIEL